MSDDLPFAVSILDAREPHNRTMDVSLHTTWSKARYFILELVPGLRTRVDAPPEAWHPECSTHGRRYAAECDGQTVVAVAKRLIEIDNDDVLAHTSLSMFYQAQGKIEEAEKEGNVAKIMGWKQDLRNTGR